MSSSGFCLRQDKERHRDESFLLLLCLHLQVFLMLRERMNGEIDRDNLSATLLQDRWVQGLHQVTLELLKGERQFRDLISPPCFSFLQGSQSLSWQWPWCVFQTSKLMLKSIYPRWLGIFLQLEQMTVAPEMKISWHIKGNVKRRWRMLYWQLLNHAFVQVFGLLK